ncbi:hypothetical protein ACFO25_04840 [Paenactinomyces guangxiensis]|uniref:Cytosolic protein n=1 Tax=Paenactinomyces guangxiensis TaxID=1490290 RepID=A0A7W1WPK4_9BACL|nr:hypothetical protein [Paenactinomyces guangxiensis]MBA4493705.1 hypothetical protein [Paenactinomyces guangxiensis]MBH8590992.1 hypothetical protein [Paenactinomyces guangxiensis]
MARDKDSFEELETVQSVHNEIIPEEFPEGPYGAATTPEKPGKTSPWRPGQRSVSAFTYEMRQFHEGLPRVIPGSHPTHDEPEEQEDE